MTAIPLPATYCGQLSDQTKHEVSTSMCLYVHIRDTYNDRTMAAIMTWMEGKVVAYLKVLS